MMMINFCNHLYISIHQMLCHSLVHSESLFSKVTVESCALGATHSKLVTLSSRLHVGNKIEAAYKKHPMKKFLLSAFIIALLSCNDLGSKKMTNETDTTNTKMDTTSDTSTAPHPGPNGYAPPNAKGGDSLAQKNDSTERK